ncbi:MAG: chemotaxis protein CheD [Syntrophobacterales bacterium]|nr:chemotaxis protein CheD [Syntrophobacterales bacterium]
MPSQHTVQRNEYFLKKGYIYIPSVPTLISTVLGSGISVCLWDRKRQRGGMNYFLYPETGNPLEARSIYGNVATIALVKFFREDGSEIKDLEAQIIGGATPIDASEDHISIARGNVFIARKILRRYGIPIVAEDVGGTKGRKVVFNTFTSEIAIVHVDRIRREDWYPYQGDR